MAVARTRSVALVGVAGRTVEVEADVGNGLAGIHLIGLPDTALSEARDRVRSAMVNSNYPWPDARIIVSLFPASLPKRGSQFDLAIAVAILGAAGVVPAERIAEPFFLGELGLDGRIRAVRGVLPSVLGAAKHGDVTVVVPSGNSAEAVLVPDVKVIPVADLRQLVEWLRKGDEPPSVELEEYAEPPKSTVSPDVDLADVVGQPVARRALEVCAAGGHNLWMLGPPGTGKTMLAERLPTLLPDLELDHALEVTAIHSVAGVLPPNAPMMSRPPFVSPHHTATSAAIIGGGSTIVRPGAVSLAHRGVLFMDEAPEFPRHVLDALRQPLESGRVTVSRSAGSVTFPARFMLILAANPCPCAQAEDQGETCKCSPTIRRRYLGRLSGPLLDRIDMKVTVARSSRRELLADRQFVETSKTVAERVLVARERAAKRLAGTPWRSNAEVPSSVLHADYRPSDEAMHPMTACLDAGTLTARGLDRVVRVAWTLADLADKDTPGEDETNTALGFWLGVR
ncbi:MG(2+) CHELATASE FAMILY PROTEIN / ComM-related protein [[Actinomadura] parvosata subsp. kistnae]|uniref:Mg chelatase-like protein n=1 Tax=[Actinomadura] parvosata subsp. kistnae TaxID=1909395 RepID=A0A1V0A760_9ACTN|nr:YifB family Mg chelatase-like AAA ATPase [Nonomuraea sp. ATCC 55076]AQZ66056.1 Mg chelatase-like protein [Nonomuraea sp. ATCC 55076]SPL97537.1 MG(2+) CHELATASE FAMILY PROTEIN / ComM-related protein [Actinomadura parvosata subsp. kistnae]